VIQPEPGNRPEPPAYFPVEPGKTELFNCNRAENSLHNRRKLKPEKTQAFQQKPPGNFRLNRKKRPDFPDAHPCS